MTTLPLIELRPGPLADAAREYARPGAAGGMRQVSLTLVRDGLRHYRDTLDFHSRSLRWYRDRLAEATEVERRDSLLPDRAAAYVARTLLEVAQLETTLSYLREDLSRGEDTMAVFALLDECAGRCLEVATECRRYTAELPRLTLPGLTDEEATLVARYDVRERAATAAPFCSLAGGVGAAVGFAFGGILPAVLAGTAVYAVAMVVSDRALRRVIG